MKAGFGTGAAPASGEPTGRAAFTPPSPAELTRLLPQLEVVELLGQGGMGAVYKARQPALDRWVALKVLPPQTAARADFSERFNREARALARLTHQNIVAVHDFGKVDSLFYLLMEYVNGVSLRQLLRARKLAPEEALAIVPKICEALQYAHEHGVVHRDIKPENVLLNKEGQVKIADFGIAKIVESEQSGRPPITGDQQVIGTPHYMAPEQVEHPQRVDHRADIYSLGVVFYEMLTGELPLGMFAAPSHKVQVDVRLDEVVLKALEKEPERRYQQASQVKTEVDRITRTASTPKPRPSSVLTGWKVALCASGAVVLVALGLAILPFIHFRERGSQNASLPVPGHEQEPAEQTYETAPVTRGALRMVILEAGRLSPSAADPAQWQVNANLPETSVVHIEVGQEVECLADAFPGRVFKGKVTRVDDAPKPGIEPATYTAVVRVTNPGLKFREGMSVRLAFIIAHRPNVLRIPSRALLFRMPGTPTVSSDSSFGLSPSELAMADADERAVRTVWVMRRKNEPEPVRIRIGITDGTLTEVVSGLSEGERVVIRKAEDSSRMQSDNQPAPTSGRRTNVAGFGSILERVLRAKDECFLDLDTGQTHGPAIIGGASDLPPGMDLSIPYTQVGTDFRADRVVGLEHLEVQPADDADWDLPSNDLSKRMEAFAPRVVGGLSPTELANSRSGLPRTYLFRTSEWSEGVLQIVAFTQNPPGVRIRCRFLATGVPQKRTNQGAFGPPRRLAVDWPDGVSIELLGLSQYPSKGAKTWRPDGHELPSPLFDESSPDIRSFQPPGTRPVELVFSIAGLKSGPGSEAKFDLSNAFWTGRKYKQGVWQPDIKAIGLHVPTNARVINATLVLNAAEQLRMNVSLRTNVWLTDAASLLPAPLAQGERAVVFMYVSVRPGYATFPQARPIDQASTQNRTGMVAKIYALKSGEAGRLLGRIKSMVGAAGEAVRDQRSNSIMVSASPSLQESVAQLLRESGVLEEPIPPSRRTKKAGDELPQDPNAAGFGPLQRGQIQPNAWADPNLSAGLATLVWHALAEPLEAGGDRYVWLSTTVVPAACAVRGEITDDLSDANGRRRTRGMTLYFVAVDETAAPQVCGALVQAGKPFEVKNLPAGRYQVIAIAGPNREGLFDEIGVPVPWRIIDATPEKPIEDLKVQMSSELSSWVRRSFRFDSGASHLNAENIETESLGPHGRVGDQEGRPIPGALIQVREFASGRSGIEALDTRANYQGYYGLPPLSFQYHVGANVYRPLNDAVGVRWQTLWREKVLDGKQRIDFAFAPWPGDGKSVGAISGTVIDREGQPVSGYLVEIRPGRAWPKITEASDGWFSEWGIRIVVDNGQFVAREVPAGGCVVRVLDSRGSESGKRTAEVGPAVQTTLRFVIE